MTVISSRFSIVKDSLIRARDREDISKDESSFSCRYTEWDVESKCKAKGIEGVMDFINECLDEQKKDVNSLITQEIVIAQKEGQPTSRLTSLYNKINK